MARNLLTQRNWSFCNKYIPTFPNPTWTALHTCRPRSKLHLRLYSSVAFKQACDVCIRCHCIPASSFLRHRSKSYDSHTPTYHYDLTSSSSYSKCHSPNPTFKHQWWTFDDIRWWNQCPFIVSMVNTRLETGLPTGNHLDLVECRAALPMRSLQTIITTQTPKHIIECYTMYHGIHNKRTRY